ncbi:DNA-processing protein DprA [Quadrisphaera sp. DSM 44207]|uniref:DNA-processing protein DprA n=1 Tax=Quadrisphaera sp. DSM 44207 TaxID=1881057 RepID=UPI00088B51F4|nr:DNA-processing protein DprA [Quadrisphaera sp. DSM 44207]SDQ76176.1 DNA protecting protein DprA [Quadrisphaera sp. DSM 44207]
MSASTTPPAPARPRWADDERLARAAWSRLVESGDAVGAAALAALGPLAAVDVVLAGSAPPEVCEVLRVQPGVLHEAVERWRVRLPGVAPERDVAVLERLGGRLVVPGDVEWPAGLDDLGVRAPACLWVRGPMGPTGLTSSAGAADAAAADGVGLAALAARSVALVGARACTAYGQRVATDLACGAAERGVTVVSGGAYGIDAAAHRGALVVDGPTVAVLACGVDRAYPQGNDQLLARIAAEGALVSEVPPGSAPTRWRFLERNRLIAALAGATVVVEAAWRSGALSTARYAGGLLRPLGAVPGPVTSPASAGCHRLLREEGAVCVSDVGELLELVEPIGTALPQPPAGVPAADHDGLPPQDLRVLDALPVRSARPLAALAQAAGLPETAVLASLGRLSLRGLAERRPGEAWRRAPRRASSR